MVQETLCLFFNLTQTEVTLTDMSPCLLFLSGRSAVRRRQPEESPGEGEAGSFPHASLHPSRLSEPAARHD